MAKYDLYLACVLRRMDDYSVYAKIIELIRMPDRDMTNERFQDIDGTIYERGEDGFIGKKNFTLIEFPPDCQFKTKKGAKNKVITKLETILEEINDVIENVKEK